MKTKINLTTGAVIAALLLGLTGTAMAKDTAGNLPNMYAKEDNMMEHMDHHKVQEANKAAVKKFYDVYVNQRKMADVGEIVEASFLDHDPTSMGTGLEGLKKDFSMIFQAFPDLKFTPEFMVAEGDKVVVYYLMTGTNTGEFMGAPATNKKISVHGVDIVRLKDGKAVEHWGYGDSMTMMQQMGMGGAQK
jgi:steroid delta-isomerase-like uncharacterized protein